MLADTMVMVSSVDDQRISPTVWSAEIVRLVGWCLV